MSKKLSYLFQNNKNTRAKLINKQRVLGIIFSLIIVFTLNVNAANQESLNTLDITNYIENSENIEDEKVDLKDIEKEVIETNSKVEELDLDSRIALIYDRASGEILYEKNGNKQTPMASTTKIMTAIVVLENSNLNDVVTIDAKAAGTGGSRLGLKKNDKITVNDLLYGLMLRSRK